MEEPRRGRLARGARKETGRLDAERNELGLPEPAAATDHRGARGRDRAGPPEGERTFTRSRNEVASVADLRDAGQLSARQEITTGVRRCRADRRPAGGRPERMNDVERTVPAERARAADTGEDAEAGQRGATERPRSTTRAPGTAIRRDLLLPEGEDGDVAGARGARSARGAPE